MLSRKPLALGDLRGTIYDFPEVGDEVPKHNHTEDNAHITVVCRGKILAYSHDWEHTYSAGDVINFPAGQPHALRALDAGARIINIVKKHGFEAGQIDMEQDQ